MIDRQSIEDFLYLEASLLDRPDLDAWMSLFTDDGVYWMPAQENQTDPHNHISHVYDDRVMMEIRRRNFLHPRSASKDWQVRCSHIIGNIRICEAAEQSGAIEVISNQHVVVWYREEQRVYAYRGTHVLISTADSFKIRSKRVDLINADAPQKSLTIYL